MLAAMSMVASCGSKSNSDEASSTEENVTEAATPTYEPADPPFTYSSYDENDYENIPLKGLFEIEKVALAKVTGKIRYSAQLDGEGDCIAITANLKMVSDFSQKPDRFDSFYFQLINKDGAVLLEVYKHMWDSDVQALKDMEKGDVGVINETTDKPDIDVDDILANTKYVRITHFSAGKKIAE